MASHRTRFLLLTSPIFLLAIWMGKAGAFSGGKIALQSFSNDWTFSARPALGPAYELAPVRVVSVTTEAANGPEISRVYVKNQSSKAISAVKLTWRLVNRQLPAAILGQGQTPLITLKGGLAAGERKKLAFSPVPLLSFGEISKSLAKNGSLTGEFLVEVAAHEAVYADKETWKIASAYKNDNASSSLAFMKASFSLPGNRTNSVEACAKQECEYFESGEPPTGGYRCKSTSHEVYCTNCGTSCTESLCGESPPDCS